MAENSAIEWTHHTFNPWIGCTKVGPGCDNCYAADLSNARLGVEWGAGKPRRHTAASTWKQPRAWNRKAEAAGIRQRVFCASLADVFDNEVPAKWRAELFDLIRETPHLDWLLVTKRIGNVAKMTEAAGGFPGNVWLGATIVNHTEADRDIPKLLAIDVGIRFLSVEPLLGPIDLTEVSDDSTALDPECWGDCACDSLYGRDPGCRRNGGDGNLQRKIDWVIVGGESGPHARPMHPDWARSLRDQCEEAGVPFLFKQWGEFSDLDHIGMAWNDLPYRIRGRQQFLDGKAMIQIGKKLAGRLLDGVQHDGYPEVQHG